MRTRLATLDLQWNAVGQMTVRSIFHRHRGDSAEAIAALDEAIVAISAPITLANRFGVLNGSHGIALCDGLERWVATKVNLTAPINRVLKRSRVNIFQRADGSISTTLDLKHPILHNSRHLEDALRQMLANFVLKIYESLPAGTLTLQLDTTERELDLAEQLEGTVAFVISKYVEQISGMMDTGDITAARPWSGALQDYAIRLADEAFLMFINVAFDKSIVSERMANCRHQIDALRERFAA